jgi:hypothetical protein
MTNSCERNLEIARKFVHTSPLSSLPEKVWQKEEFDERIDEEQNLQ